MPRSARSAKPKAVVCATRRHRAHLVVERGPAYTAAAIAETHELECFVVVRAGRNHVRRRLNCHVTLSLCRRG